MHEFMSGWNDFYEFVATFHSSALNLFTYSASLQIIVWIVSSELRAHLIRCVYDQIKKQL